VYHHFSHFAAAVAPFKVDVVADMVGFAGSDQDFVDRFFVPGIQRAGGLDGALRLITCARAAAGGGSDAADRGVAISDGFV